MIAIGAIGYAAVGAAYALLTILLVATWRGHRIGLLLILASVISVAWGFLLAAQIAYGSISPLVVVFAEVLRATGWVLFLGVLVARIGASRILLFFAITVPLVVLGWIGFSTYRGMIPVDQLVDVGTVFIRGGLGLSLIGLVLIEQLYRNSPLESKWSLKPLVLGLGGIFAFDLFLFSQGVLLSAIDVTTWLARGVVNLLFVPMIAIAARRNKDWELRIFVSRHVVFYSTTLTAVGLYLLLMSFGGYLIVIYGGSWGSLARIVFFAGAVIVLISLLFSSVLRARLKVFLNKHFFHNKYDYRDEWLRLVATLSDFDSSVARDVAIKAIAQIVNSPAGVLWVRDDVDSDFRVIAQFANTDEISSLERSEPVVTFIEKSGWLVDLGEYSQYPERYDDLKMPDWISSQKSAWLLVPLQSRGEILGLILLYQAPGHPSLNYEDRDLLKTVGNHIAVHIAQSRSDSLLAESQQFEAYNRLTAFLMHDLSNLVAQQSLIVANAEKHKHNPDFIDDAISTIAGSVERMKKVIRQLKSGDGARSAKWTELRFIVSGAIDRCAAMKPLPSLESHGGDVGVVADAEEFMMVLAHLIRNAQDACSEDGSVDVSIHESGDHARIEIADNGEGMSKTFIRERLFRPFDSTKGNQGMGIGAYQAREFARRLGGELVVQSKPGAGTTVTLRIPIDARD